jgi:hypothetical protein
MPDMPVPDPDSGKPVDNLKPETEFDKDKFSIESLDTFKEHKVDLSGEVAGKSDEEILDLILDKDDSELVPWETVTLPSRGIYYEGMIPDGVVKVRPMGIYTEKILSTLRLAKTGKALDMIFQYCVKFPNPEFTSENLLVGDSTFILFYLRGITFGNMYDFTVKCSNTDCGAQQKYTFDLNELATTIKGPSEEIDTEPFEVRLPYLSESIGKDFSVKVRMFRRYDLVAMTTETRDRRLIGPSNARVNSKKFKDVQAVQSINDVVEKNLATAIVEVMGSDNRDKINKLIQRLHSSDTAAIRDAIDEFSPGVDTTITCNCNKCDNEMKVSLPISESFFRRTV